jgi:gliding motility-associated-like protein
MGALSLPAFGQSYSRPENNVWLNGGFNGEGISFNSGSPEPVASSWQTHSLAHGSASVCDAQGNLLFYSDGNIVWNRNNDVMQNGWDINNNGNMAPNTFYLDPVFGSSSYNFDGVVIIPMPGSSHKYYIFCSPFLYTENSIGLYSDTWTGTLYGTVVDMEQNNGLGGVDTNYRGIALADSMAGNLQAVVGEHCDFWLLGFGSNGSYKAFNITEEGFNPVPVVSTLTPPLNPYVNELNVSPNRLKAAMAATSEVQLTDFDPATGGYANEILFGGQQSGYVAFSPNSQLMYFSGLIGLRQYDLNNLATPFTLLTINNMTDFEYDAPLRLGPDNKMYLSYYTAIPGGSECVGAHVVHPDVFGTGCQMELIQNVSLPLLENNWIVDFAFPNEIPVLTYDTTSTVSQVPLCFHEPEQLRPEDTLGTDYHWMANTIGTTYIRKGNDSTAVWLATDPGTYALQYFSSNPCTFHQDTFIVKAVSFSLYLGPDQMSCEGEPVELKVDVPGGAIRWPDGSTADHYQADTFGRYWVEVSKEGCTASDTINVAIIDINQDLGVDTTLCFETPGDQLTLTAKLSPGASVLWSTGSSQPQIRTSDSGLYWLQVTNKDCIGIDSIYVHRQFCDCPMLLPNAFSPNGDGNNDLYKPALPGNCPVAEYKLQVYNRWGKMLFVSYDPDQGWNGTINGKPADIGTYYYHVQMKTGLRKIDMNKSGSFTLLR